MAKLAELVDRKLDDVALAATFIDGIEVVSGASRFLQTA